MANQEGARRGEAYLRERIAHLEKVNQDTLEALRDIVHLADFKTSLNRISDVSIILAKSDNRLRRLMDLGFSAFYTFDEEDMSLFPAFLDDEAHREAIETAFDSLVESMRVAKCINGTGPVFATLDQGQTMVVLHPLYTSSRIRGMFMGSLKTGKQHIADAVLAAFSVILGRTANMLESFELYGMIRDVNIELEDRIEELARNQSRLENEVTLRKGIEANLRDSRIMLELIMEHIPQHVFWKGPGSVYLGCNRNFALAAGLESSDDIVGKTDNDLPWAKEESDFFTKIDKEVMDNDIPALNIVETITTQDGKKRFIESNKVPLHDDSGKVIGILGTFNDITEKKVYEAKLTHQAFHDSLTGLPNRALIIERIERAIERVQRNPKKGFAVMLMDLDRFKYINDSMGHLAGDRILVELGNRLATALRSMDTVARLGGDEFAILIEELDTAREMIRVLRRIMKIVRKPYTVHGSIIHSAASVGVVLGNAQHDSAETILRYADTAMYSVKNKGGSGFKVYTSSMGDTVLKTATLQNDLTTGLVKNEFVLEYQPIFSLADNSFKGAEALIRWDHPTKGRLSPDEFIPIAEETGLIIDLGTRILNKACAQAAVWMSITDEPFYISVNISSRQLRGQGFISIVENTLKQTRLPPEYLAIEVTETVLMERTDAARAIMRQLRDMGVRLFLDDFGTGYSSLSYLQQFPVNTLKIDRSFVTPLGGGKSGDAEIIKAIVALARSMDIKVIAEGVETKTQLAALQELQCDYGQGYLYSRPLPPGKVFPLIRSRRRN